MPTATAVFAELDRLVPDGLPDFSVLGADLPAVGVAVSGGGDSTALLILAKQWADERGRPIFAAGRFRTYCSPATTSASGNGAASRPCSEPNSDARLYWTKTKNPKNSPRCKIGGLMWHDRLGRDYKRMCHGRVGRVFNVGWAVPML